MMCQKENMHYTCIACVTIDSVLRIECKYRAKEIQMPRFINTEVKSDSDSDSDSELDSEKVGSKFDAKLMAKLESGPDSE